MFVIVNSFQTLVSCIILSMFASPLIRLTGPSVVLNLFRALSGEGLPPICSSL